MATPSDDRKRLLSEEASPRRKKRAARNDEIPTSSHYHISWMHANVITTLAVSIKNGYVISGDQAGIVKFWKRGKIKIEEEEDNAKNKDQRRHPCLEFVKAFTAHSAAVQALEIDAAGDSCVSVASDPNGLMLKFYEISTFDAVSVVKLKIPNDRRVCCTWFTAIDNQKYVAVSAGAMIHIVSFTQQIQTLSLHASVITAMSYIPGRNCIISTDEAGAIDVWDSRGAIEFSQWTTGADKEESNSGVDPSVVKVGGPCTADVHGIAYESKIETDLYDLQKKKGAFAVAIAATPHYFSVYSSNHKIRVFDFVTAKILATFSEGIKVYDQIHSNFGLDGMEYGKRAATEREIQSETAIYGARPDVTTDQRFTFQFDNTGHFLLIPCMLGIKVLDWRKPAIAAMVGQADSGNLRFVACKYAWGDAMVNTQMMLARGASTATTRDETKHVEYDALMIAVAYNQRRLYVFSHIDPVKSAPDDSEAIHRRDVWNEAPTASDQLYTTGANPVLEETAKTAILRTTMGDIHIQLFPQVPRTIENFVGHCKSGYYDNVIFHRVIAGFMLQTGDPQGDGTGGESIWGGNFEDEIIPSLRHDRPFTVSMANAGTCGHLVDSFQQTVSHQSLCQCSP